MLNRNERNGMTLAPDDLETARRDFAYSDAVMIIFGSSDATRAAQRTSHTLLMRAHIGGSDPIDGLPDLIRAARADVGTVMYEESMNSPARRPGPSSGSAVQGSAEPEGHYYRVAALPPETG